MKSIKKMTEQELRSAEAPHPKSKQELIAYIESMSKNGDDYGTAVYAMSLAAVATFNYMGRVMGVTGFQASCADLDFLRRTRGYKHGFKIIDYDKLLYPQYWNSREFPSYQNLLEDREIAMVIKEAATKLLEKNGTAHQRVRNHWFLLSNISIPEEDKPF